MAVEINFKNNNLSPLQFVGAFGVSFLLFPLYILLVKDGGPLDGIAIEWLAVIIGLYAIAVYIAVHYLPKISAIIAGIIGWLSLPVTIVIVLAQHQ
jgi:hypothetical protein